MRNECYVEINNQARQITKVHYINLMQFEQTRCLKLANNFSL